MGRLLVALRGGPSGPDGEPEGRPLTVSAAIAALGAAATTMVTFMAVAVIGWFLADAGAHGQTTDALRVGADAWLVGNGSGLSVRGVPLGIVPLTLTLLIAAVVYRYGRWAAHSSQEVDDDRTLGIAATIFTGLYMVVAVVTCVLVGHDDSGPGLGRAIARIDADRRRRGHARDGRGHRTARRGRGTDSGLGALGGLRRCRILPAPARRLGRARRRDGRCWGSTRPPR